MATLGLGVGEVEPSRRDWAESARILLFKSMFTGLCGVTASDWLRIVARHGLSIEPRSWHRAALMTIGSGLNSWYKWKEDRDFGAKLAQVEVKPPVFILGHWRSGTTLLHNLLALDGRFAYPNLYEVFFPHTFLGTEDHRTGLVAPLVPQTRVFDNVAQGFDMPNEDEFATAAASLCSPYMSWSFPKAAKRYEAYLTFRNVHESERLRWETAFVAFLKKLTLRYQRPLLLKSPPHTGRLSILARLFPEARFVHVHRDPYAVFQSTKHMSKVFTDCLRFQKADPGDLEPGIIRRYQAMHDAYFDERGSIPEGHLHELAFEELEVDPIGRLRRIYEVLNLGDFEAVLPKVQGYVESLAGYRKNHYHELQPETARQVRQAWERSFEAWGYGSDREAVGGFANPPALTSTSTV